MREGLPGRDESLRRRRKTPTPEVSDGQTSADSGALTGFRREELVATERPADGALPGRLGVEAGRLRKRRTRADLVRAAVQRAASEQEVTRLPTEGAGRVERLLAALTAMVEATRRILLRTYARVVRRLLALARLSRPGPR